MHPPAQAVPEATRQVVEAYVRGHDARRLVADAVFTDVTTGLTWSGRQSCGRAAVIMSQIGIVGSDCISSITLCMIRSGSPPK